MKPLRVLYLHMIGAFGGASRSLYEAVRAFPPGEVQPLFVAPRGSVQPFFAQLGEVEEAWGLSQVDNTRYSHYRGLRWLVALRELAYLPATILALRRARRRWGEVDLIHLNEFTGLIPLWLARRWFGAPAVVHVRSVARQDERSLRTRWVDGMLRRHAAAVVAIDENVRASLPADLPVEVIHNGFAPAAGQRDEQLAGKLAKLRPESFKVGFVGNMLVVKGIFEFIEAARMLQEQGLDIEYVMVGDDAQPSRGPKARILKALGLVQNVRSDVEALLDRYQLRQRFHMVGFTRDIRQAYDHMDVLCFPSHYDAPGRPIFEAAFSGVPAIAAVRDPKPDTLVDGVTGIAIPPKAAPELAAAIARLARDPGERQRMGEAARAMAERNFDVQKNAARLLAVYRGCVMADNRAAQVAATE